ncbi:glycosylasparaginase [Flavihumibacter petaseus NBRC 106054]|uniref:Glycosylasparaginase n=2 Tax=Flavihumibacter TaxID=1004301 RepID=A0A0E9N029_9BACT|nr:glycosylasparaginase [Flavihumibacter petaseus NBRC 106054]
MLAATKAVSGSAVFPIVISTWDFGREANEGAWAVLAKGGRAVDAVEAGVRVTEAAGNNFTVGLGGLPDRDGRVTLDACIMDDKYGCGSVMCLENILHPVSVARLVMDKTPHIILVGEGAQAFALANGFKKVDLLTPASKKAWKEWLKTSKYEPVINIENKMNSGKDSLPGRKYNHDTIGMLAIDQQGNVSGACTTSGMAFKMQGRVGDSPVIGAGLYVDNEIGGATATGVGEEVIRIAGAHLIVELMRQGFTPQQACREAVERIVKRSPAKAKEMQVGFLALNKQGVHGAFCLQEGFSYAVKSASETQMHTGQHYF